jgi:glycoprotein endo-alpha-1,2-mannosidase
MPSFTFLNLFRRLMLVMLFALAIFPCYAADVAQGQAQIKPLSSAGVSRQVLAFYYDWYGNPTVSGNWVHWEKVDAAAKHIASTAHFPALGAYDSHDPKLIEEHFREAKDAGITGFIVTWWGQGDFHDQTMPLLLQAAQKHGISLTVYFENVNKDGAVKDILYLLEKYGKHPAWLKIDGRPVLFIYSRAVEQLKVSGWQKVIVEADAQFPGGAVFIADQITKSAAPVFDGVHTYNVTAHTAAKTPDQIRAWAKVAFKDWVRIAGTNHIACLTVIPGYDDSSQGRKLPRPITERFAGRTYQALWEEAIAANPDWILITSWNEWHEGSEIEPSVEFGDQALKATAIYSARFRALKPRAR